MRSVRPTLRHATDAVSGTVVAFLVAGVIFIGVVAAGLMAGRDAGRTSLQAQGQVDLQFQAKNLGQLILGSPGYAQSGTDWGQSPTAAGALAGADTLTRIGLQDSASGDPSRVSFAKFQNLRLAPYDANPTDGYVNYPEARHSLGLDSSNLDFHLRAYPTLHTVQSVLGTGHRDPNLRVTYIGHIGVSQSGAAPTAGLTVSSASCTVSPLTASGSPQAYRVSATVTNGGTVATQFTAFFQFQQTGTPVSGHQDPSSRTSNSYLIAAGQSASLFVDLPATTVMGGCDKNEQIKVDVQDPGTAHVSSTTVLAASTTGATAAPVDLWLDTTKPAFINPGGLTSGCQETVKFAYSGPAKNEYVYLKVTDSASATVFAASQKVPASINQRSFDAGCLIAGQYVGTLYYCGAASCTGSSTTEQVNELVLVTTTSPPAYSPSGASGAVSYSPTTGAVTEVDFLATLADRFCPYYFDSTTVSPLSPAPVYATRCAFKSSQPQPGDVFPDSKQVMNNDLHDRLIGPSGAPRYDYVNVLVAGSDVDQGAMTSQAAKGAVADWVMGGGTLIVFGSSAQNVNWLEPIFHAAIRSSSGGLSVPDPDHPLLHTADELDFPHYDNLGRVWSFSGQTAANAATLFTNVVVEGADPVTTESNGGAMGSGSVILTTWQPYDPYQGARDAATTREQGLKLANNLLMQGYRDLFLDYGPALPANTDVVPSVRMVQIQHPDFTEPIQLSLKVFVFP